MASEIDDLLKSARKDAVKVGMDSLIRLQHDDIRIQQDSNRYQSNMLSQIVETNDTSRRLASGIDLGIGKIIKVIQEATDIVETPPAIPTKDFAKEGMQYQLEYLDLIDTRIDEGNGLMRGVLSQVTRIRTVIDDMLKRQLDMEDKKVFKNPDQEQKGGPKVKLKEGKGGILETLMELGGWLFTPITKWLWPWIKEKWTTFKRVFKEKVDNIFKGVTDWFDNVMVKAKNLFDDAVKLFAKKFPKITTFFKSIKGVFAKVFKSSVGKWVATGVGLMSKLGGQIFGGIFSVVGKVLSKAILPIMLAYDFFMGWFNADEITGKLEDSLSIWDKAAAGLSSILSGLTLGFVTAQDWYEVIFGDYGIVDIVAGFFKDLWAMLPEGFKNVMTTVYNTVAGLAGLLTDQLNMAFGDGITQKIETLFDDIAKWMDENISWAKLKPSWLPTFGGDDEADIDAKNKAFTKVQNAKAIPLMLDTSSKSQSDKKALLEAKKNQVPLVLQAPAPNVTVTTGGFNPNVFEADMFMQLSGR